MSYLFLNRIDHKLFLWTLMFVPFPPIDTNIYKSNQPFKHGFPWGEKSDRTVPGEGGLTVAVTFWKEN